MPEPIPAPLPRRRPADVHDLNPPPHHADVEAALLSSLLCGVLDVPAVHPLRPEHLYLTAHQRIYEAVLALHDARQPVGLAEVIGRLRETGRLADAGGVTGVTGITQSPDFAAPGELVRQVIDAWARREGERIGQRFVAACRRPGEDIADLLHKASDRLARLNEDRGRQDRPTSLLAGYEHDMQRAMAAANARVSTVSTGYASVDEAMVGGWWAGKLAVVGARPGTGKTAVAIKAALACAQTRPEDGGGGALVLSVELPGAEMRQRILSHESGLTAAQVRQPAGEATVATMNTWLAHLCGLPLWVDDGARTIGAIRASVRRHVRLAEAHGAPLRLVALDYLQLVRSGEPHKSRQDELTEVCRQVAEMRNDHPEVSFLVLAQLNRESSDGRKPRDSDLRDCGQVEQDADTIALLWRPEKDAPDLVEMTFAKNRGLRTDLAPRFRVHSQIGRLEEETRP